MTTAFQTLLLVLFMTVASLGQTATFKGVVYDKDKEPISFATITLSLNDSIISSTKSDFDGSFIIAALPAGLFDASVIASDYNPAVSHQLKFDQNYVTVLDFRLELKQFSQDTTATWLFNIDTLAFKTSYKKRDIPHDFYGIIGIGNLDDIANPTDVWTGGCTTKPHRRLNWIAMDKNGHWVICYTYGGKGIFNRYYYFDNDKGKLNVNQLIFDRQLLTFGQTVDRIRTKQYEFELD